MEQRPCPAGVTAEQHAELESICAQWRGEAQGKKEQKVMTMEARSLAILKALNWVTVQQLPNESVGPLAALANAPTF